MTVKVESPEGLFDYSQPIKDWIFSVYRKLTEDLKTKTQTNSSPSVSAGGSMTIVSSSINHSSYSIINNVVFFECKITLELGGTTSNEVIISLPYAAQNDVVMTAHCTDAASEVSGSALTIGGTTTLKVRKYDNSNWSVGTGRVIRVSGSYRTNNAY